MNYKAWFICLFFCLSSEARPHLELELRVSKNNLIPSQPLSLDFSRAELDWKKQLSNKYHIQARSSLSWRQNDFLAEVDELVLSYQAKKDLNIHAGWMISALDSKAEKEDLFSNKNELLVYKSLNLAPFSQFVFQLDTTYLDTRFKVSVISPEFTFNEISKNDWPNLLFTGFHNYKDLELVWNYLFKPEGMEGFQMHAAGLATRSKYKWQESIKLDLKTEFWLSHKTSLNEGLMVFVLYPEVSYESVSLSWHFSTMHQIYQKPFNSSALESIIQLKYSLDTQHSLLYEFVLAGDSVLNADQHVLRFISYF